MPKGSVRNALLVLVFVMAASASADDCRKNCTAIFKFCKQGCVENYTGIQRRASKIGCRKAKKASIRACRTYPQACPPLE
jgi:hypothetical protein